MPTPATRCSAPFPCPLGGDYWVNEVALEHDPNSSGDAVWGIADTHAHMAAHLAFGGKVISGCPDGPAQDALCSCRSKHGLWGLSRSGLIDGFHHNHGFPDFRGWPKHSTRVHQQMYVEWIRRAYHGGLRLIVSLAVDNQLLARLAGASRAWNDRDSVAVQVAETCAFVARHHSFMEIAYTPRQARQIISDNRLAVILGMEVDSLGMHGLADPIQRQRWLSELYFDLGVRHVFPIHLTDNVFGGAAVYEEMFDFVNIYVHRTPFELADPPLDSRIDFRFGLGLRGCAFSFLKRAFRMKTADSSLKAHSNAKGLSVLGAQELLPAMMKLGMILDVDHMSSRAVAEVLEIAGSYKYPLVAGHAAFQDLAWTRKESGLSHRHVNEYCRSGLEVERIAGLGGMLSVGLNQGDVRAFRPGGIENDCAGSAKSFAQSYLYAACATGQKSVALGSDMNGLAGCPGPRFGPDAAAVLRADSKRKHLRKPQQASQSAAINYGADARENLPTRNHPPLSLLVAGSRSFDLNLQGVAHYGLLPDFLQDLRNVGLTHQQLSPLFRSAEDYIRLWEKCDASASLNFG